MAILIRRRQIITGLASGLAGLALGGRSALADEDPAWWKALAGAESLTKSAQRLLLNRQSLAPEYPASAISTAFKANGSTLPNTPAYKALFANSFKDYRLEVKGLVDNPLRLSLEELRAMAPRTQITRHDCVEGWSCIGKWTGVPLSSVLQKASLKPAAKFLVFNCFDNLGGSLDGSDKFYGSIDLVDAAHPQTILAYDMNGAPLAVPHGAPLRLRVERQLGYKMNKYIQSIEAVDSFANIGGGKGGYWEDRGYQWYAGI